MRRKRSLSSVWVSMRSRLPKGATTSRWSMIWIGAGCCCRRAADRGKLDGFWESVSEEQRAAVRGVAMDMGTYINSTRKTFRSRP